MKISPIPASGVPTLPGITATPGTSSRVERAIAIAAGETPPESTGNPQADKAQESIRKLKMRTNYSTDRDSVVAESPVVDEVEPVVDTNKEVIEVTKPLSPQAAMLQKQRRQLQLERAEFEKQKTATTQGMISAELLKQSPLKTLLDNGVTYDQLTQDILSNQNGASPEIQELKNELKSLKNEVKTSFETQQSQAEESALTEMLLQAEDLAKEGDTYELIRGRDAYDRVLTHIYDTYKKTNRVVDVATAMNKVENELLEEALKYGEYSKVKSKFAPQPLQAAVTAKTPPGLRTLTARNTATAPLSARQRAMAAFNGTLKR